MKSVFQPVEELRGEVADNDGSASSQNAVRRLECHGLEVENTSLGTSMNHGKLATNLVGRYRHVFTNLLGVTDNVEVLAGRLDHDDIGTLANITLHCSASETASSRGELVA